MKLIRINKESLLQDIDLYLLIVRWSAIFASAIIYIISKPGNKILVPPFIILLILISINLPISIFIWRKLPYKSGHIIWILILDIIQGSISVFLTGGYDSLFFVMYLLAIAEAGICLNWNLAAGWIISIDGVQILSTTLHWAATGNTVSSYALVGRFLRLIIVGLIVIMLGELLRREEINRNKAIISAANLKTLNTIFTEFESTDFNNSQIFEILLKSLECIENVGYSFVIFRNNILKDTWEIHATSKPQLYPIGFKFYNLINYKYESFIFRKTRDDININKTFFNPNIVEVIGINLSDYNEKNKGLLIIGKNSLTELIDDEDFFLKALALEAQLVLHNTYIFQEKQNQIKQLAEFKEMQTTFFSAAGHEIKTPLTILKTLLSTLRITIKEPTEVQNEIFNTLESNVARLDNLTTDILETAKLETSELVLNIKDIDLLKIINKQIEAMLPIAERKNQKITVKLPENFQNSNKLIITGDSKRISQIISNLLSNALKFSKPDSSIDIEISLIKNFIQICIFDNAPVLTEEEEKKIFDKYYTSSNDKALSGFGLGLFIVKKLVDLHNGKIWVQKRSGGKGFCFNLPLKSEGYYENT